MLLYTESLDGRGRVINLNEVKFIAPHPTNPCISKVYLGVSDDEATLFIAHPFEVIVDMLSKKGIFIDCTETVDVSGAV